MKSNRRKFISTTLAGGLAATIPLSSRGSRSDGSDLPSELEDRYTKLDEILNQPVLKRELFTSPWKCYI